MERFRLTLSHLHKNKIRIQIDDEQEHSGRYVEISPEEMIAFFEDCVAKVKEHISRQQNNS